MSNKNISKEEVSKLCRLVSHTNMRAGRPRDFTFKGNQLFFLGSASSTSASSTLQQVLIPSGPANEIPTLEPHSVIRPEFINREHKLSKEEQLLRERQRLSEIGVTSYFHTPSTSPHERILVPAGDQLLITERQGSEFVLESTHPNNGALDLKWSPDGKLISCIIDSDIRVIDLQSKTEHQITSVHAQHSTKSAGESKFIIQEEFDRYTAYWWAPKQTNNKEYNILYLVEDEGGVTSYGIPQPGYHGEIDSYSYPLVGGKNTTFEVWIASITLGNDTDSNSISVKRTNIFPKLYESFPWCEYIVRAGWMPSGNSVWVQLLDRPQERIALVELPVDPSHGDPKVLFEERSDYWINVTHIIHVFEDGRIIWASEKTGFRKLYILTPSPSGPHTATPLTSSRGEEEWIVGRDSPIGVDEANKLIYFTATKDTPLETHLYAVSYAEGADPTQITRLTPLHQNHSVTLNDDCTMFVAGSSSLDKPLQITIYKIEHEASESPKALPLATVSYPPKTLPAGLPSNSPRIFEYKNKNGVKLYGCVYLPPNYDTTTKKRTLVKIYGGPHVQLVNNSFDLTTLLDAQMYTSLGFIVVIFDNTGSDNRGLKFEGVLKHKMGTVEISDQVDGIDHLIQEGVAIDRSRIAVTGWSYGGYLSLMALAQRPDVFKIAIPKCPVALWEAYDTGYTERYMGTPTSHPDAYRLGSVLTYANTFPDEEGRLLIVHGLQDENVHFSNSTHLIDALIAAQKPYQLLALPKERHGCANPSTRLYLETACAWFMLCNL